MCQECQGDINFNVQSLKYPSEHISALWTQMCMKAIPWAQAEIADGSAIGYPKMHSPKGEADGTTYIQLTAVA